MNTTEMMVQNQEEQARELAKIRKLLEQSKTEPTVPRRIAKTAARTADLLLTGGLVLFGAGVVIEAEAVFHELSGILIIGIGIVQGYLAGIRWKLEERR